MNYCPINLNIKDIYSLRILPRADIIETNTLLPPLYFHGWITAWNRLALRAYFENRLVWHVNPQMRNSRSKSKQTRLCSDCWANSRTVYILTRM